MQVDGVVAEAVRDLKKVDALRRAAAFADQLRIRVSHLLSGAGHIPPMDLASTFSAEMHAVYGRVADAMHEAVLAKRSELYPILFRLGYLDHAITTGHPLRPDGARERAIADARDPREVERLLHFRARRCLLRPVFHRNPRP